jgi:ppGpp synthetase/RelA/SpoT-type nucleotidyltranferase
MPNRTVEDRLREEYFDLLPDIRRVAEHLEAEVKYHILPISRSLDKFERIAVSSRIKECDSALESLRRRQEGATFDPDRAERYTLTSLKDLAGVRVLAFPKSRLGEIDIALRTNPKTTFPSWTADPVLGNRGETLAFKYWGHCSASSRVPGEFQIVSVLTGLFWEIEHSAIYKPAPRLRGVARALGMQERSRDIQNAISAFEEEFERLVRDETSRNPDR